MNDEQEPLDSLYLRGAALFDAGEYFAAHDAWEEVWTDYRGPLREFYKGLIHAAVALYHFGGGNRHGAEKLYHSCRAYLTPYGPRCQSLDLERFLQRMELCFQELLSEKTEPPPPLNPDLAPTLGLEPVAGW